MPSENPKERPEKPRRISDETYERTHFSRTIVDSLLNQESNKLLEEYGELGEVLKQNPIIKNSRNLSQITQTQWIEIYASLNPDLLKKFDIRSYTELMEQICFGKPLNRYQTELIFLEIEPIETDEDLQRIQSKLLHIDFFIFELGKLHIDLFKEKLDNLLTKLDKLKSKKLYKTIRETATNLKSDIEQFEKGQFYKKLKGERMSSLKFDKNDARSKYLELGIDSGYVSSFIEGGIPEKTIIEYSNRGFLETDFYPFILNRIPIFKLNKFLDLFTESEKIELINWILSEETAKSLNNYIPTELVADYIRNGIGQDYVNVRKLEKTFPELAGQHGIDNITLIQWYIDKPTDKEKITEIKQYEALGLGFTEMLIASSYLKLPVEKIKEEIIKYNRIFSASEIVQMHILKINPEEILDTIRQFDSGSRRTMMDKITYIKERIIPEASAKEILDYVILFKNVLWQGMKTYNSIRYFIQNKISPETVQKYIQDGLTSPEDIVAAIEGTTSKYSKEERDILRKYGVKPEYFEDFQKYNLAEVMDKLRPFQLDTAIALAKLGVTNEEILEIDSYGMGRLGTALTIIRTEEDWKEIFETYSYLLEEMVEIDLILTMKFFGITKGDIEEYNIPIRNLNVVLLSSIILNLHKKGKLQKEQSGIIKKYNLSFPARYPSNMLRDMREGCCPPERKDLQTAMVIQNKSDWNDAFDVDQNLFRDIHENYNEYAYEVSSVNEFMKYIEKFGEGIATHGKTIDLLIIGGHGTKNSIAFSSGISGTSGINTRDKEKLKKLKKYFNKDSLVILSSCSTGEGGIDDNIASTLSEIWGIKVVAPNTPTGIKSFTYDENHRITGVNYQEENADENIIIDPVYATYDSKRFSISEKKMLIDAGISGEEASKFDKRFTTEEIIYTKTEEGLSSAQANEIVKKYSNYSKRFSMREVFSLYNAGISGEEANKFDKELWVFDIIFAIKEKGLDSTKTNEIAKKYRGKPFTEAITLHEAGISGEEANKFDWRFWAKDIVRAKEKGLDSTRANEIIKTYSERFFAREVLSLFEAGISGEEANAFDERWGGEDIVRAKEKGLDSTRANEIIKTYSERFFAREVLSLFEAGISGEEASKFDPRFRAENIVYAKERGLNSTKANEIIKTYSKRFSTREALSLFEAGVGGEEAGKFDEKFWVDNIIFAKEKGLDSTKANEIIKAYGERFFVREILSLFEAGVSSKEANEFNQNFFGDEIIKMKKNGVSSVEANKLLGLFGEKFPAREIAELAIKKIDQKKIDKYLKENPNITAQEIIDKEQSPTP